MNLRHLEFVLAAALERSFSRAAERCHVTQPTLSNGIALLEEELGGQIFVRTTRKVELSAFGQQVLPLIETVVQARAELETGVRSFHDPSHKVARIGLSLLVDTRRVSEVLQPYLAEHPGVETFFKECYLGDLEQRLHDGQLDIVIRTGFGSEPVPKSVVRTSLYEEDLFFLPRQVGNAVATEEGAVLLKDIAGEIFVLGPDGCGLASMTRNLFKKAGVTLNEYTGQALSYQVMLEWADIGIGATILPESKISSPFRKKARRLMLTPKKPARASFEALWMRDTAYPRHVIDMHRHFLDRVPLLLGGAAPRQLPGRGQSHHLGNFDGGAASAEIATPRVVRRPSSISG
jgi:LysR family hydrogen peroxide-inducible transcriptional activator